MDPTRFFDHTQPQGSAAPSGTSGDPGVQAHPGQPHVPTDAPAPDQAPSAPPVAPGGSDAPALEDSTQQPGTQGHPADAIDPERYRHLEQQNQQYQRTLQQIGSWASQQEAARQRQQIQDRYHQRIAQAKSTALNMSPQEAIDYMARQQEDITREFFGLMSQAEQAMEQRVQQERQILGTPLWVKALVQQANLPELAEQELLALGDPRLIERQLPIVRQRYEQNRQLQERLDQMARQMQANQLVQNGAGIAGGTIAPQSAAIPADADPDTKAMLIYRDIKARAMAGTQ